MLRVYWPQVALSGYRVITGRREEVDNMALPRRLSQSDANGSNRVMLYPPAPRKWGERILWLRFSLTGDHSCNTVCRCKLVSSFNFTGVQTSKSQSYLWTVHCHWRVSLRLPSFLYIEKVIQTFYLKIQMVKRRLQWKVHSCLSYSRLLSSVWRDNHCFHIHMARNSLWNMQIDMYSELSPLKNN